MNITAADLPDRLRQMARNGLTETMSGRRVTPPDSAAAVVEFAADTIELRDAKIVVLSEMFRSSLSLLTDLAEAAIPKGHPAAERVAAASKKINATLAMMLQPPGTTQQ